MELIKSTKKLVSEKKMTEEEFGQFYYILSFKGEEQAVAFLKDLNLIKE